MPDPIITPVVDLVFVASRLPAGIVERLARGAHGEDDEIVDLALLLRLHPLIGIEGAVRAVAARHLAGDLAGKSETSNVSMRRAPLLPSIRRCQVGSTPQASGVTIPSPVTTTRLISGSLAAPPMSIRSRRHKGAKTLVRSQQP